MNPAIRDGQILRVRPVSAASLKPGSIVLYRIHGRLNAHRLIHNPMRAHRIFAVADAALEGGDWIPADDILGVAESMIRDGQDVRLDTRRARWGGLMRYCTRPLRRWARALLKRPAS